MTTMPLRRLSICPCGYGSLHDDIPLGTIYRVIPSIMDSAVDYRCGGCGYVQRITCIWAEGRGGSAGGMLPFGLFEESSEVGNTSAPAPPINKNDA